LYEIFAHETCSFPCTMQFFLVLPLQHHPWGHIWHSHFGKYVDGDILGYDAVWTRRRVPPFRGTYCVHNQSDLKMVEVCSSETMVRFYVSTLRRNPQNCYGHHSGQLQSAVAAQTPQFHKHSACAYKHRQRLLYSKFVRSMRQTWPTARTQDLPTPLFFVSFVCVCVLWSVNFCSKGWAH
jgi:hypothetical protein